MTPIRCAHVFPEGPQCSSDPDDHIHEPLPCANGSPERHHEYEAPKPHEHVIDRCVCGYRAEPGQPE